MLVELKTQLLRLPEESKRFLHSVLGDFGGHSRGQGGDQYAVPPTDDSSLHKDDTRVADEMGRDIRVLCWVMTSPQNLDKRCVYIQQTWGRRCNKLLFFSSVDNATFPTIGVGTGKEGRDHLMSKQSKAFQFVYDHYYDEYDWFLKTDDDAYVIMENLRYFLSSRDTNQPVYFGHHFKTIVKGGYFSGGPGIVLGKLALKRTQDILLLLKQYGSSMKHVSGKNILVTDTLSHEESVTYILTLLRFAEVYKKPELCRPDGAAADAALGQCLYNVGVYPGNSTDLLGRSRFHCFKPSDHTGGGFPAWYYKYDTAGGRHGMYTMSDYAIGFHYVSGVKLLELEYLIYHLRPYGVRYASQDLNQPWTKGNITIQPL